VVRMPLGDDRGDSGHVPTLRRVLGPVKTCHCFPRF
jgi:hypothetical protein